MQDVCLGRKIYRHQRSRLKSRSGGHVENAPRLSFDHPGKVEAREMSQRGYIQLNLPQTFFEIVLGEQTVLPESRVVDQHIQLKPGACRLIEHISSRSGLGQVGSENQRTCAMRLFKFRRELPEPVAVARHQHQVITLAREDASE